MAGIAALASAGMGIYSALTSDAPASNVQLPPQFQMPGMGQAANSALQGIQNLPGVGLGAQTIPQAQAAAAQLYNNPGQAALLQGAYGAQNLGQNAALGQYGQGGALASYGAGLLPYSQSLLQMGFDPQQALYNRTAGQLQQQSLANLANAGLGTSPYGQGVLGNTMGNFNIDWQNQQLQRALQGAQGAGNVLGQGGQAIGAGTGLQNAAAGQYGQFGALPFGAYGQIGQGQFGALQGLQGIGQGAQELAQTPIKDYLSYLGQGTQQQNANAYLANVGLQQANAQFNQNQQLGQNLGGGLYGLGQAYNRGFPGAQQGFGNLMGMTGGFGIGGG